MTSLPSPYPLASAQGRRLHAALERAGRAYDPAERMLRVPFTTPGYHTQLKGGWVHPTRESLTYAVALLDGGGEEGRERALGIVDRVLALQDIDPASRTYGIWSWFLEEPLEKMAPPDWNWADFLGAQLLEIASTHGPFLPAPFPERIRAAVLHAAASIRRRDVAPDYTNIAIMGSFVTLAAAELYGDAGLKEYALAKLRRFDAYTREQGGFTEYNSPNYTVTALDELSRLLRHARDAGARATAEGLYRVGWEEVARHFHAPTGQWAGPQSRSYQTFLPPRVRGLLHRATEGRFPGGDGEPEIDEHRLPHRCPADLEPRFFSLEAPRDVRRVFLRGRDGRPDAVGTTRLEPAFALGSVNAGDLWNQRRALLAYWGGAAAPSALRLRFLRDGYDFAAAHLFSAQRGGDLAAGIAFAFDGGDTHVCLDMIRDGTIRARDLRLRFQVEGADAARLPAAPASLRDAWTLEADGFRLSVAAAHAVWDGREGRWERGGAPGEGATWLDVVLHAGEEREFRLPGLAGAALAFVLRCGTAPAPAPLPAPRIATEAGRIRLGWEGLEVAFAAAPARVVDLLRT